LRYIQLNLTENRNAFTQEQSRSDHETKNSDNFYCLGTGIMESRLCLRI